MRVSALLLFVGVAAADTPAPPPPHMIYAKAEIVVTGKVELVRDKDAVIRVESVLKGKAGETVTVGPIVALGCFPGVGKPFFAVGDRVIVAAERAGDGWRFLDPSLESTRLDDSTLPLAKEMLRVLALEGEAAQRAAMVELLRSESAGLAHAAARFQEMELWSPERAAPHVKGLVLALDAPCEWGRYAAMRALKGLTPEEAVPRLIVLSREGEWRETWAACAALAPYDREDAAKALIAAAKRHRGHEVDYMGASPREEVHTWLREAVGGDVGTRKAAFRAYAYRLQRFGTDPADVESLLAALRKGVAKDEISLVFALRDARSDALAPALLAIVTDAGTKPEQRRVAYTALWEQAEQLKVKATVEAVRGAAPALIARLDAGDRETSLVLLLRWLRTDACRAALERAAAAGPDPEGTIARALAEWGR